jgi:hypothetical protein
MKWDLRTVLYLGSGIVIIYIVGVLSMYIFINSIIFTPDRTTRYEHLPSSGMQTLQVPLPEQQYLEALLFKPPTPEKSIVLYLHSVKGNLDDHYTSAIRFTSRFASVLMPDYRGYGKTPGHVSETSLNEDALACMDWIRKRYREDSVIIYAQDFMAPVACFISTLVPCRFVILENPVFSLRNWMRNKFPALIQPYELKYDFNLYESMPSSIAPVFIIQSQNSRYCSDEDAKRLQMLLKDPNAIVWLDNDKNIDIGELEQYAQILDQLFSF